MSISPARAAAFDILLRVEHTGAYASELLHSSQYKNLSPQDHGLTTELVMGVLRWRSALDAEIARFSSQKLEKLDVEVLTAARLAAYQLLHLERIPARAAVHESVELVRKAGKRSAVPFANAVLRKLAQSAEAPRSSSPSSETAAPGERFAHPPWLVERWTKTFGAAQAEQICRYNQKQPQTAIRCITAEAEAQLRDDGVILQPGLLLTGARRVVSGDVTKSRAFRAGRVSVQDEGSQLVAMLAGKGTRILDCCAAPGGKTRVLAERNPQAEIVAVELHPHRARLLRKLVPAANVEVITADILRFPAAQKFDLVLADVSCSGTGTLARNPEIKWRLTPGDLADLASRQLAILQAAMQHVAPGGSLAYSTCSLEPEENSEVAEKALQAEPSFRLLDCGVELQRLQEEGELAWRESVPLCSGHYLQTIPGVHPCDGFFAAIMQRG